MIFPSTLEVRKNMKTRRYQFKVSQGREMGIHVDPAKIEAIKKWEKIMMDLVTKKPRTSRGHDSICVRFDQLMKSAHFLPIREDYKLDNLVELYINEIV
ncbi:hypothetical protein Tco_0502124 [Tanacetum coccineum]